VSGFDSSEQGKSSVVKHLLGTHKALDPVPNTINTTEREKVIKLID
jgi:hypothetical protein